MRLCKLQLKLQIVPGLTLGTCPGLTSAECRGTACLALHIAMLRHRRAFTAGHSAQLIAAESHCRWRSKRDPEGVHRGLCLLLAPLVSPPEPSTWCDLHRPALQAMNTRQTARLSCHDDVLGDQTQTTRRHPMLCAQAPTSEVSLDVDSPCKTTPEVRTITSS